MAAVVQKESYELGVMSYELVWECAWVWGERISDIVKFDFSNLTQAHSHTKLPACFIWASANLWSGYGLVRIGCSPNGTCAPIAIGVERGYGMRPIRGSSERSYLFYVQHDYSLASFSKGESIILYAFCVVHLKHI